MIQTGLTRIINAKAAIKTAIEGKGVTVPDGTLLDGMASLLASIEAGGVGVKIASGTIVLSEPSSRVQFIHELGEPVNFFSIFTTESSATSATGLFSLLLSRNRYIASRNDSSGRKVVNIGVGTNSGSDPNSAAIGEYVINRSYNVWADNNKVVIDGYAEGGMMFRLKDGIEYMWFATTWSEV